MQNKTVGQKIKEKRLEKGLTQKQLGDLCEPKMKDSAIRRYESGKVTPKTQTLKRIAKALEVSVIELQSDFDFGFTDKKKILELFAGSSSPITDSRKYYLQLFGETTQESAESENSDKDLLSFFHHLNDTGKDKVIHYAADLAGNPDYRKESDSTTPIAAHNDNVDDAEQQKLMKEDIDEL